MPLSSVLEREGRSRTLGQMLDKVLKICTRFLVRALIFEDSHTPIAIGAAREGRLRVS